MPCDLQVKGAFSVPAEHAENTARFFHISKWTAQCMNDWVLSWDTFPWDLKSFPWGLLVLDPWVGTLIVFHRRGARRTRFHQNSHTPVLFNESFHFSFAPTSQEPGPLSACLLGFSLFQLPVGIGPTALLKRKMKGGVGLLLLVVLKVPVFHMTGT